MISNPRSITLCGLFQSLVAQRIVITSGTHSEEPENISSAAFSGVILDNILPVTRSTNWLYPSCFDYVNMRRGDPKILQTSLARLYISFIEHGHPWN